MLLLLLASEPGLERRDFVVESVAVLFCLGFSHAVELSLPLSDFIV